METITNYKLSRTHGGNRNYLLISQSKIVKFDHNNAVEYDPTSKTLNVLEDYLVKDIKDNSKEAEENLLNYLEKDAMSPDNLATNKYSYFRVILADGRDIICTGFKDFKEQYNSTKTP